MSNFGSPEMVVLSLVLLWFFGGDKLKEIAKGIGEGMREIKKIKEEIKPDGDNPQS